MFEKEQARNIRRSLSNFLCTAGIAARSGHDVHGFNQLKSLKTPRTDCTTLMGRLLQYLTVLMGGKVCLCLGVVFSQYKKPHLVCFVTSL